MALPSPAPGLVISYAYLWRDQDAAGAAEGRKNRPCAVVVTTVDEEGDTLSMSPRSPIPALIIDNAWQAERAEQTLTHFPRQELDRLSQFYAQQDDIRVWVEKEEETWVTLRMLEGDPNRLGPGDISALRNALQKARNLNFLMTLNSQVQLQQARGLSVAIPAPRAGDANALDVKRACAPLERTLNPDPMGTP